MVSKGNYFVLAQRNKYRMVQRVPVVDAELVPAIRICAVEPPPWWFPHLLLDKQKANKQGWRRRFPPKLYVVKMLSTVTVSSASSNAKVSTGPNRMISALIEARNKATMQWSTLPPLK